MRAEVPYEMYVSGVFVANSAKTPIYWLDNESLLFAGHGKKKPKTHQEYRRIEAHLYLWRLGKEAERYPAKRWTLKGHTQKGYCAERGNIYYDFRWEKDDEEAKLSIWTRYSGPPGAEQLERLTRPIRQSARYSRKTFSQLARNDVFSGHGATRRCEPEPDVRMTGRTWLRDNDGSHYLDFGKNADSRNKNDEVLARQLQLIEVKTWRRFDVPLTLAETRPKCAMHDRANNRFVLWSCPAGEYSNWSTVDCYVFWTLDEVTRELSRYCIPPGPWSGDPRNLGLSNDLLATSAGFFFNRPYSDTRQIDDAGVAALYQFSGGQVRRILPGHLSQLAVSPDGCKLAFHHQWSLYDSSIDTDTTPMMKVIDLCKPK